jgi:hypothetical protein
MRKWPRVQHCLELLVQVVRLARAMVLVELGTIVVDGTEIKANASRHTAMRHGRMKSTESELKAQIAALLRKAAKSDEAEWDIPAELARRRRSMKRRTSSWSMKWSAAARAYINSLPCRGR